MILNPIFNILINFNEIEQCFMILNPIFKIRIMFRALLRCLYICGANYK
jgi:hypothetical protein